MSEQRARTLVYTRSRQVCECCGFAWGTEWHHRKNRSQGGRWTTSNGLHLCSACHQWITTNPKQAADEGGWVVWSWQDPLTVPVKVPIWGWVLLDDCGGMTPALDLAG